MKKILQLFALLFSIASYGQDKKGCDTVEPNYVSRMPGFIIAHCKYSEFDEYNFAYMNKSDQYTKKSASGILREIRYDKDPKESRKFSGLQIRTNYENAFLKAKGESLSIRKNFFRLKHEGKIIYMKIDDAEDSDDRGFSVVIIEEADMKQDVVASISEGIDRDGKIALYGILFDVNKTTIKPESEVALKEVIDYLNANPAVKIVVVGHTDNTGIFANNITLSKGRALSVKDYLVKVGKINPARLLSDGVGALCPVSTNETDDGRKLNRRVEIVKQ